MLSRRLLTALAMAACCWIASAGAQSYPTRPVRLLVGFPPGGVTDATMRKIAEKFQQLTGQPMVIENRPGRGVATQTLVNAEPDGHTLGVLGKNHMTLYWMQGGKLPYDPVADLTYISALLGSWFGVAVLSSSPYKSVADLVTAAKVGVEKVSYGTSFGPGGLTHVPMSIFESLAGVRMLHVPFKGDAESTQAMMAGILDVAVVAGSIVPHVQSGKARLLAWLAEKRHPRFPEVPTFKELGYPAEAHAVVGIGGPKGLSPAVVAYLDRTFERILDDREVLDFLDRLYQRPDFRPYPWFTEWAKRNLIEEKEIVERFGLVEKR